MAIHNLVINYAQLKQAPQIAIDRNTGIPINGYVVVKTIRADRFIDDGNDSPIKEDYPIIFTTDPAILQEMQTWSSTRMKCGFFMHPEGGNVLSTGRTTSMRSSVTRCKTGGDTLLFSCGFFLHI